MTDQTCKPTSSSEVYFFLPAVSDWIGPLGWISNPKYQSAEPQKPDSMRVRYARLPLPAGLWEEAAFAVLGLSGVAAIVAALA